MRPALSALLLAVLVAPVAAAESAPPAGIPAPPAYRTLPLPYQGEVITGESGDLSWVDARPESGTAGTPSDCWGLVRRHWNPATGATGQEPLGVPGMMVGRVVAGRQTWFLATAGCRDDPRYRFGLLAGDGVLVTGDATPLATRPTRLVVLSDDALLVLGLDARSHFPQPRIVRREGRTLATEELPALPVRYRDDFALVALDDHRVMLLGGSDDGASRGCSPCRASTQVLDTAARRWTAGPDMREARSELAAFRLPDGSVIAAGGWTLADFWGPGPSRTAERWDPARDAFAPLPPMPVADALGRFRWMPGREGRTLLLVEGMSAGLPAFDVATRHWFNAGMFAGAGDQGGCAFMPFVKDGQPWAWQTTGSSCGAELGMLSALHLPREPHAAAPAARAVVVASAGEPATFVPPADGLPAVQVGGRMPVGSIGDPDSGVVDGIDEQGRLFALASLTHARREPEVLRVGEGLLVVGGLNDNVYRPEAPPLPAEWLPSTQDGLRSHWQDLPDAPFPADAVVAARPGGGLLELRPAGDLARVRLVAHGAAPPAFERAPWAMLARPRRGTEASPVRVRELADGRVVVAGGEVRSEMIALDTPDVDRAGAKDEYLAIGPWLPERRHDMIDAAGRTVLSAPSRLAGGAVAILDDGRVVKAHPGESVVFEIHDPRTDRWADLPGSPDDLRATEPWRMSAQQAELLLVGGVLAPVQVPGGHATLAALWRLDLAAQPARWERLWLADRRDEGSLANHVLVLKRPDGRTLVVPLEGS